MGLCECQRACVVKYMRGTLSQSHFTQPEPLYWLCSPLDFQRSHFSSSRRSQWHLSNSCFSSRLYCQDIATGPAWPFTFCETRLTGESDRTHRAFFPFLETQPLFSGQTEKMLTENFHLAAAIQSPPEINEALPLGIVLLNLLQSNAAFF